MTSAKDTAAILDRLGGATRGPRLEVFGPIIEFLTPENDEQICVMRAVVPPGVTVPLHSHDDFEDFLILAGGHQVLIEGERGLEWRDARPEITSAWPPMPRTLIAISPANPLSI
jgi:hypothetical protein